MKCANCRKENLITAKYCSSCGNGFSEKERQDAWDGTVWGKLDKLKEAKEWITLEKITGSKIFKAALLVLIILWGLMSGGNKGDRMLILESSDYTVRYNSKLDEYYVFTDKNEVDLDLYLPGKPQGIIVTSNTLEINVTSSTLEGAELDRREYEIGEKITLTRSDDVIYHIEGVYEKSEKYINLIVYDSALLQ